MGREEENVRLGTGSSLHVISTVATDSPGLGGVVNAPSSKFEEQRLASSSVRRLSGRVVRSNEDSRRRLREQGDPVKMDLISVVRGRVVGEH